MKAELNEIEVNGVKYVKADLAQIKKIDLSSIVLVRTYSAGVHFGELSSREDKCVVLKNARRLWFWEGACSLSQVAVDGVDIQKSKIAVIVPEITLMEAIEIIPMSAQAAQSMMEAPAWRK